MGSRVRVLTYPVEVDAEEDVIIVTAAENVPRWRDKRWREAPDSHWLVVGFCGMVRGRHAARIVVDCTGLDATLVATEFARYTDWLAYTVLPMLLPDADAHLDICGSDPDLLGTLAHYAMSELAATVERAPAKAATEVRIRIFKGDAPEAESLPPVRKPSTLYVDADRRGTLLGINGVVAVPITAIPQVPADHVIINCRSLDGTLPATEYRKLSVSVVDALGCIPWTCLDFYGSDPQLPGTIANYVVSELAATVERAPVKAEPKGPTRVSVQGASRHKLGAVRDALHAASPGTLYDVRGVDADVPLPWINEQPIGFAETLTGARARAGVALDAGADMAVGIESGLLRSEGVSVDIGVIVIRTPDGKEYVSTSTGIRFPEWAVDAAAGVGFETTTAGSILAAKMVSDATDPHTLLTFGAAPRRTALTQGVMAALAQIPGMARTAPELETQKAPTASLRTAILAEVDALAENAYAAGVGAAKDGKLRPALCYFGVAMRRNGVACLLNSALDNTLTPHADLVRWLRFNPDRLDHLGGELAAGVFDTDGPWTAYHDVRASWGNGRGEARPGSVRFTRETLAPAIDQVIGLAPVGPAPIDDSAVDFDQLADMGAEVVEGNPGKVADDTPTLSEGAAWAVEFRRVLEGGDLLYASDRIQNAARKISDIVDELEGRVPTIDDRPRRRDAVRFATVHRVPPLSMLPRAEPLPEFNSVLVYETLPDGRWTGVCVVARWSGDLGWVWANDSCAQNPGPSESVAHRWCPVESGSFVTVGRKSPSSNRGKGA